MAQRFVSLLTFTLACGAEPAPVSIAKPEPAPSVEAVEATPVPPSAATEGPGGPRIRVLGTAQDGGLPHAACTCERCAVARKDPTFARRVASLAIMVPGQPGAHVVDATPDIRHQLHAVRDIGDRPTGRVDRSPLAGVFLTHAHLGHYTGLAFLGFEAVHAQGVPVWATPAMHEFLRSNAPWSQLVGKGEIVQRDLAPGTSARIGPVAVEPVKVPHRDEFADTVGFLITGPTRRVFYVPDTEPWPTWTSSPADLFASVDVAIVDGTFYSGAELPGREVSSIGHPLMTDTMDLLENRVGDGTLIVYFTHLNHSNPVLDPRSAEREAVVSRGFRILADGQELAL